MCRHTFSDEERCNDCIVRDSKIDERLHRLGAAARVWPSRAAPLPAPEPAEQLCLHCGKRQQYVADGMCEACAYQRSRIGYWREMRGRDIEAWNRRKAKERAKAQREDDDSGKQTTDQ